MIGLPYIEGRHIPSDFNFQSLKDLVLSRGLKKVYSVDLFDANGDYKWDLNFPVPRKFHNNFKVLIDIGTLEHIFDTSQCLENYFRLISQGGLFILVTPVNGYFGHGLHVFNPETILNVLKKNGFQILYKKFTTSTGIEISDPSLAGNILLWIIATKKKKLVKFIPPQQGYWKSAYLSRKKHYSSDSAKKASVFGEFKYYLGEAKRGLLDRLPIDFRTSIYRLTH